MPAEKGKAPYLVIEDLTKKFGEFKAVDSVSLDVEESEFICFLGPSGCGKTTLLRAIAGLDIQTSGRINQGGRDISILPPEERDFGIVFQSYALFPNLTVLKNVAYGLENRKLPRKEIAKRVKELLQLVGLPDQGAKYPAHLSGGQQQRVALARALATSPGLLLLDEPLSALDAKVRVFLRQEIKDLQQRLDVTTIMVTHDQEEALTMADRIVVMNEGVIEQVGTPVEIYREPATAFVADFIGTMNFIPGSVLDSGKIRIGPNEISCNCNGYNPGSEVYVAIRPEDFLAQGVVEDNENMLEATIDHMEFLGSFWRAGLVSPAFSGERVRADFSINLVRQMGMSKGSTLSIKLPSELLRVFARN